LAITDEASLIAAYAGAKQKFRTFKLSATTEGAGTFFSLFKIAGGPIAGATPGSTALVPTKDTVGALNFGMVNPTGGDKSYLSRVSICGTTAGSLYLYDRLVHVSGLSGTNTSADTAINSTAITRPDALGEGVQAWAEFYSAIGATARTLNVRYTDQDGNTDQVGTYAHPANAESVGQIVPIVLDPADVSVRAVTAYHWSGTTGTAGDFGITLRRLIAGPIPLNANQMVNLNIFDLGFPEIPDDCCLEGVILCSTTNSGIISGSFDIIQG
jgi:hypothetical protein